MTTLSKLYRTYAAMIFLAGGLFVITANPAVAQVACPVGNVVVNATTINGNHIFCGEVRQNGTIAGFHSRPGGVNPGNAGIANVVITQAADAMGIYNISFTKNGTAKPLSTMYPDSCTQAEVEASIEYAVTNPNAGGCQVGANNWTCGKNRPAAGDGAGYCVGDNPGARFYIAFHVLPVGHAHAGNINTAFPLR